MHRFKLTLVLIFAVALMFGLFARINTAKLRATHADESEQASTFLKLRTSGTYTYNPNGPHGATLYYYSLIPEFLANLLGGNPSPRDAEKSAAQNGNAADRNASVQNAQSANFSQNISAPHKTSILSLRLGLLGIFALTLFALLYSAKFTSLGAAACAAAALCFSALSLIYSAYYVHESIFALAGLCVLMSGYAFAKNPSAPSAIALGAFAGLMQSTKETAPIAFLALAIALIATFIETLKSQRTPAKDFIKYAAGGAATAMAVCVLFYSSFGSNMKGVSDALYSYIHFADKSHAAEHSKEFLYYFKLLFAQKSGGVWFGEWALTLLGIAGAALAYAKKDDAAKFVRSAFLYFLLNVLLLSFIPYKMPWLLLLGLTALCIPAGYAASYAFKTKRFLPKLALMGLLALALFGQTKQLRLISQRFHSDPRNPFISVHTVSDFARLEERVKACAKFSQFGADIPVCVYMDQSPWPMPWAFKDFKNAGFWTADNPPPQNIDVFEIIITDSASEPKISALINPQDYKPLIFGLRENLTLYVFIKKNLFFKSINEL